MAPFPGLLNCSQTTAADYCYCCAAPDHTLEPRASSEQLNVTPKSGWAEEEEVFHGDQATINQSMLHL
jgi:hypothetical protein